MKTSGKKKGNRDTSVFKVAGGRSSKSKNKPKTVTKKLKKASGFHYELAIIYLCKIRFTTVIMCEGRPIFLPGRELGVLWPRNSDFPENDFIYQYKM